MTGTSSVARTLHRAAMYRLCAMALAHPGPRWRPELTECLEAVRTTAGPALQGPLGALRDAIRVTQDDVLAGAYVALFDGASRCAPYEGAYGPTQLGGKVAQLADIAGFYTAFGVEPGTGLPEVEDHIASELEFMSILALKEAWAIAEGHHERAEISHDAAVAFLADHVGYWATSFAASLAGATALPYYRAAAGVLTAWVEANAGALGAPLRPRAPGAADPDGGAAFQCPMADDQRG